MESGEEHRGALVVAVVAGEFGEAEEVQRGHRIARGNSPILAGLLAGQETLVVVGVVEVATAQLVGVVGIESLLE